MIFSREGVGGLVFYTSEGIYIPLIVAERPGSGSVGKFLDDLPKDRRVVVPAVVSSTLEGMLLRRGFVHVDDQGESVMERVPCEELPVA